PAGLDALGRRAADALDRSRADRTPARAAPRRALAGAGAGARGADHGAGPEAREQPCAGGAARGAERSQRPIRCQSRDRAEPRPRRRGSGPGRAQSGRAAPARLSRVLAVTKFIDLTLNGISTGPIYAAAGL